MQAMKRIVAATAVAALVPTLAGAQDAPPLKVGVVSFLSGAAAGPFGVPARNGAEIMIEMLNAGKVPAPYNTVGFGGASALARLAAGAFSPSTPVLEILPGKYVSRLPLYQLQPSPSSTSRKR